MAVWQSDNKTIQSDSESIQCLPINFTDGWWSLWPGKKRTENAVKRLHCLSNRVNKEWSIADTRRKNCCEYHSMPSASVRIIPSHYSRNSTERSHYVLCAKDFVRIKRQRSSYMLNYEQLWKMYCWVQRPTFYLITVISI